MLRPGGQPEVLAELEEFTRGKPPPLARLFQTVAYNAKLPNKSTAEEVGEDILGTIKKKLEKKASKDAKGAMAMGPSMSPAARRRARSSTRRSMCRPRSTRW